jgi:hypothetical protein
MIEQSAVSIIFREWVVGFVGGPIVWLVGGVGGYRVGDGEVPAAADGEEAQDQAEEGAGDGGRIGGQRAYPADDDRHGAGEGRDRIEVGPQDHRDF